MYALTQIISKLFEQQITNWWKKQRTGSGCGEGHLLNAAEKSSQMLQDFFNQQKTKQKNSIISTLFLNTQLILLREQILTKKNLKLSTGDEGKIGGEMGTRD